MENKNPIQVAGRLFETLELLSRKSPLGLTQISKTLDLNKSTAHRILNSLIFMGYVRQEKGSSKYEPSFKIVTLANQIMDRNDIVHIVHPYLEALMQLTNETVHFVHRDDTEAVYIDKVESHINMVQMISKIGKRVPLFCSGVGKAMLAEMTDEEIYRIWEHSTVTPLTPNTITDFEKLKSNINEIRKMGYAVDNEENEIGVCCVAACLAYPGEKYNYAFSISAPKIRMDNDRIHEFAIYILKTKQEIEKSFSINP